MVIITMKRMKADILWMEMEEKLWYMLQYSALGNILENIIGKKTMQGLSQIIYIVLSELMKIKKCRKRKCDTLAPGLITP